MAYTQPAILTIEPMHPSLTQQKHRPYPIPKKPWVMNMRWLNLCFLHWPVPAEQLRAHIPEGLELDTFEGQAWLGIVPFEMRDVKPRFSSSIPWLSHFAELNVRTYVSAGGKAGVWFFSLDAENPLAVRAARMGFHLPYFDAQMSCVVIDETVHYHNKRTHKNTPSANFVANYKATSDIYQSELGNLEHFLTERYCLYSADKQNNLYRGEIHHKPWPLQKAEADVCVNDMSEQIGFNLPARKPLLHFAKELSVVAWLPEKLS